MATVVQKYGGSSVADVERLRSIARTVVNRRRAGDRVVVVVSAMGKTTDSLIAQARSVCADPPRRELDMLVTAGERIAMALLSMAIHDAGEQAISFTGSQSGIITDERHQGASILEVRPHRIAAELDLNRIVIVAGYQGVSRAREITTLGRGGSDTTAVALAAALQADTCEIYSDVDGVYSADPNVCPQARLLPELTFVAMQAMATAGAKVLNADAVAFAQRANITILARKTGDESGRQTAIKQTASNLPARIAVVGSTRITAMHGALSSVDDNFYSQVMRQGGRVLGIAGQDTLLIDRTGIPGYDSALLKSAAEPYNLQADDVGMVSLIGTGLLLWLPTIYHALQAYNIEPQGQLGHDTLLMLWLKTEQTDEAVRVLHRQMIET